MFLGSLQLFNSVSLYITHIPIKKKRYINDTSCRGRTRTCFKNGTYNLIGNCWRNFLTANWTVSIHFKLFAIAFCRWTILFCLIHHYIFTIFYNLWFIPTNIVTMFQKSSTLYFCWILFFEKYYIPLIMYIIRTCYNLIFLEIIV